MTASAVEAFLGDFDARTWTPQTKPPRSLQPRCWFQGKGSNPLEVAVATAIARPAARDVRNLWQARWNRRPNPVLLVVIYRDDGAAEKAALCGPIGDRSPLRMEVELSQAERLAAAALEEPSPHAAIRLLAKVLPEIESDLPGVYNSGLFALHELKEGVPRRADFQGASRRAAQLLGLSGSHLLAELGYTIQTLTHNSSILTAGGANQAIAIFLDDTESFEDSASRFDGSTPVSHGLALADQQRLPWVVLTRGRQIRLYSARTDVGVGRKLRADTYIELNLALLPAHLAGYLPLIFGPQALREGGTLEEILESSRRFSAGLGERLRDRIYLEAVPQLATAVGAKLRIPDSLGPDDLDAAYQQTLTILFRILFVAYAEDRDLLPYRTNDQYEHHSLKNIARRLSSCKPGHPFDNRAASFWHEVKALWDAVANGNATWGVPAYNGGLFSDDSSVNPVGAAISAIELSDAEFAPALSALLVDEGKDGVRGPVDFRSLSVREFGTIYEGLLESQLSVAPSDLAQDRRGNLVPAKKGDTVAVREGQLYVHDRSGARKATGSYFTKPFAVEHLLDHALQPALDEHIAKLTKLVNSGEEAAAAEAFFDFKCADLAMGSGHFLVAAIDRIEAALSGFLALHPIPQVFRQLERLRQAALQALGDTAAVEIEQTSLLRRMVARRCIYGVDLNPIAVELARLAIWIHTFVPGLPLSFLDHNLVCGNSLTGVATLDEAVEVLDPEPAPGVTSLARASIVQFLQAAREALKRLAQTTEATATEVDAARSAHREALESVEPARMLFDLVVAARLGKADPPGQVATAIDAQSIRNHKDLKAAHDLARKLQALHFPVAFPEVFLRDNPGFDCIIGNPPWEKARVEKHAFWALRFPGLRSLSAGERDRAIAELERTRTDLLQQYEKEVDASREAREALIAGPYPGMGTGDPDLYKAFCWRFWELCRESGRIGVVLPRSALSAKGSGQWRLKVLEEGSFEDVTFLLNKSGWVFNDAEHRYTIALTTVRKGKDRHEVRLRGPYASYHEFATGKLQPAVPIPAEDLKSWTNEASFPLLPSKESLDVFLKLRAHPRLDGSDLGTERERERLACTADDGAARHERQAPPRARPVRELDATNDKELFETEAATRSGLWPVYKGESFNIWEPDTGKYYAQADPDVVLPALQKKRQLANRNPRSPFYGFDESWAKDPRTLPCLRPRIAFRDVTNRTNQRTVIAALIPGRVFTVNKAPTLVWPRGDERDEAYLLGVLCSIPLDWYARRLVETNLTYNFFNALPIPLPHRDHPLRRRVELVAGRLAATDERFAEWARAVGVPVGSVRSQAEKQDLVAELDALVSTLYGLDEDDVRHIFETFHVGWDYHDRLEAVLEHFRKIQETTP